MTKQNIMNLKTFLENHSHIIENAMYTDYSFTVNGRIDIVVRIKFATTIDECASLLQNAKLFGNLKNTFLHLQTPYGLISENVLMFEVTTGKYVEEYNQRNSSTDAISFTVLTDEVTLNVFDDGKLTKSNTYPKYSNVEYER